MSIEMKYHNVYYYCGILSNIIEYQQEEFLTKLWEFSHEYLETIPKDYSKISVLVLFCRWSVKCIMEEDMRNELIEFKNFIKEFSEGSDLTLKRAFWNEKESFSFEVERAIEHYYGDKIRFYDWLNEETYDFIEDAFEEYLFELWIGHKYEDIVNQIANEMFYILFQNRKFLLLFNFYMSRTHDKKIHRTYIPQWVKRAVFYRDRGKCVLCNKDLSGQLAIIEDNEIHYDHIVSLEQGGLNDVSNIQLLCKKCNLTKGELSDTNILYQNWYDIDEQQES